MPRARLTLTIPDGVWIGDVSRSHPDATFRVLAALADDDVGVGLVEVTAPDLAGALADLRAADEVAEVTPLQHRDDEALVQFETTMPLLLFPMQGSGTPLEMPFTIEDGEAEWEVTAPRERLAALGDQLREFDIPFDVAFVRQELSEEPLLTESQLRLVRAATERGYYDTPRTCSLTDLADDLDMAKSTVSETLHRAEGRIVRQFLEDVGVEPGADAEPPEK
ncbi:MAG: helix-turn-helix domain-containing protein [Halobacteriaceae archaeon]